MKLVTQKVSHLYIFILDRIVSKVYFKALKKGLIFQYGCFFPKTTACEICKFNHYLALKFKEIEFTQCLIFLEVSPSPSNTCPK